MRVHTTHTRVLCTLSLLTLASCASDSASDSAPDATSDTNAAQTGDASADAAFSSDSEPDASLADAEPGPEDAALADASLADSDAGIDIGATDAAVLDASDSATPDASGLPYAHAVASFHPGANAGFGQSKFPDIVLGPPKGNGTGSGSFDVLSLGVGGEIVLDFSADPIIDGAGPDFIVFENPFWPSGVAANVFAELGEVSVSDDQTTWSTFVCNTQGTGMGRYPGCAGWTPTLKYDPFVVVPLDPAVTGGDAFDLADVALASARYVRIRDLSTTGEGTSAGFDLDAVGVIHATPAP